MSHRPLQKGKDIISAQFNTILSCDNDIQKDSAPVRVKYIKLSYYKYN